MNLQPPNSKGGVIRTLRVLSLLLLQYFLVSNGTEAQARMHLPTNPDIDAGANRDSRPYLKIAGSNPLRFTAALRRNPIVRAQPTTVAPTLPSPITTPANPIPTPLAETTDESKSLPVDQPIVPTSLPESKPAITAGRIIPDDTRSSSRAEDFLPFFQFPGRGDATIIAPNSTSQPPTIGQLPASSATYQQK